MFFKNSKYERLLIFYFILHLAKVFPSVREDPKISRFSSSLESLSELANGLAEDMNTFIAKHLSMPT